MPAKHVDDVVRRGSGRPLNGPTRSNFEKRFGRDLGHVRIHTDEDADASARALGAEAYAFGSHLVFRSGHYRPETESGRRLLAHELAHTFQSPSETPGKSTSYPVTGANDADERRASTAATLAVTDSAAGEAWRAAAGSERARRGGRVRRQVSSDAGSRLRSGVSRVGSWALGQAERARAAVGEQVEQAEETVRVGTSRVRETVSEGVERVREVGEAGVEMARGGLAAIVERVSPFLGRMVREGPITVLTEWIRDELGDWLDRLLGDTSPGEIVANLAAWLGTFASGIQQDIQAAGGVDCWLFARIVEFFGTLGRALIDNPLTRTVKKGISAAHGVVADVLALWASAKIQQIASLWSGLKELGGRMSGWLESIRSHSEEAAEWVMEQLGVSGEDVLSRLKGMAQSAWETIKEDVAPAALSGLRTVGRFLYETSGLKAAGDAIETAKELWKALSWLWEHRDDPNLVEEAGKDREVKDTFVPGALEKIQSFAGAVARHVEWLHGTVSSLVEALEPVTGPLEDVPVLGGLLSLVSGLAKGLRRVWDRVSEELPKFARWIRTTARELWTDYVRPGLAIAAVLLLIGLNPWLLPVLVGGLFALGAWLALPDCYKEPVIDFVLEMAITALGLFPDVPLFGPLWSLLKPGFIGYLERAREWDRERKVAVTERVAELLLWSGPDFALGWVWGVLKGIWESLTDVFVLVWMALKGLWWLTDWADRLARGALALPDRDEEAPSSPVEQQELQRREPGADESSVGGEEDETSPRAPAGVIERLRSFVNEVRGPARRIRDNFMDAVREHFRGRPGRTLATVREKLGDLWDSAQSAIEEQGAALADRTADALLAPEADEVSGEMAFDVGEFIGWLAGTIVAEIVLALISMGIITVAKSVRWFVKAIDFIGDVLFGWVFRLVGKLGSKVMRLARQLAEMGGPLGGAMARVVRAVDDVGRAIRRLAADVIQAWKPAGREVGEAALGRGGGEVLEGAAGRSGGEVAGAPSTGALPEGRPARTPETGAGGAPEPTGRTTTEAEGPAETPARELAEAEQRAATGELEASGPHVTGRMETDTLTEADRLVEYRWIEANQHRMQPSSDPRYVAEIRLPGDEHVWRLDTDGRWCRFSFEGACFLDEGPAVDDRTIEVLEDLAEHQRLAAPERAREFEEFGQVREQLHPRLTTADRPSKHLGRSLRDSGEPRPYEGYHAHHIIPTGVYRDPSLPHWHQQEALRLQEALLEALSHSGRRADMNTVMNGIWLPAHRQVANETGSVLHLTHIHSNNREYVEALSDRFRDEGGDMLRGDAFLEELGKIKQEMRNGIFNF